MQRPAYFGADDQLQVIEISVVQKPRLLDFGKVYLDGAEKRVYQAGELERARYAASKEYKEDWPKVAALLHVLQSRFGICYVDPRPGNIDCGESEKEDPDWDKEPEIDYSEYD